MEFPGLRWSSPAGGLLLAASVTWGGCGGGGLAYDFRVPAEQRAVLSSAETAETLLRIPEDAPFNITDKTSQQTPGMHGTARGDAQAGGGGTAACSLEATNGGSGSAAFQLGHCIENRGDQAVIAEAMFTCQYRIEAEQEDGPQTPTVSSYAMDLYVNDTDGRLLKRVPVETSSSEGGPTSGMGRLIKEFRVRLEPGRVYNFVLSGKVEAKTGPGGRADLAVRVQSLQLTVRRGPARAVAAAQPAGSEGANPK